MDSTIKRIAVFCSGGDAPGMNAAIRAVVRTATYHDLHIYGIYQGYDGMIKGDIERLETQDVGNIIHRGGTILKTARSEAFHTTEGRRQAYDSLVANDIDACIAIGGNGTFTGGLIFSKEFDIPFIGIPGTIDNDLSGTDYTIGFDTAVNTAIEAVDRIRDTADSHNRLFFIEVMGRHSGYIGLYTGISSGASLVLIPEKETTIAEIIENLRSSAKRKKLFSLIIVAEGHPLGGAQAIADVVKKEYDYYETKVAVIGHLQRGGSPTAADRLLASRLGNASVEALLNCKRNVMVGVVNNAIHFTPFEEAIRSQKPLDTELLEMAKILGL
ncbi:MAG: 6-phosphofructokinase [Saprospiraceae bacterium]|nr:6-phosphofructokinase [Saprospiraceae bacterium]